MSALLWVWFLVAAFIWGAMSHGIWSVVDYRDVVEILFAAGFTCGSLLLALLWPIVIPIGLLGRAYDGMRSALCIIALLFASCAHAGQVIKQWDWVYAIANPGQWIVRHGESSAIVDAKEFERKYRQLFETQKLSLSTTPKSLPGVIPAQVTYKEGRNWDNGRRTRFFHGPYGLVYCDDPDCYFCREHVYGFDEPEDYPIQKR